MHLAFPPRSARKVFETTACHHKYPNVPHSWQLVKASRNGVASALLKTYATVESNVPLRARLLRRRAPRNDKNAVFVSLRARRGRARQSHGEDDAAPCDAFATFSTEQVGSLSLAWAMEKSDADASQGRV